VTSSGGADRPAWVVAPRHPGQMGSAPTFYFDRSSFHLFRIVSVEGNQDPSSSKGMEQTVLTLHKYGGHVSIHPPARCHG
jgi:hypothetical protein